MEKAQLTCYSAKAQIFCSPSETNIEGPECIKVTTLYRLYVWGEILPI